MQNYREGDRVKAKITAIDSEKNKLSLGIKPSYFEDSDFKPTETDADVEMDIRNIDTPSSGSQASAEEEDEEMSEGAEDSDGADDEDNDMTGLQDSDEDEYVDINDEDDAEEQGDEEDEVS